MNKYQKLGKNMLLMTVGSFASRILGLLFIPLYTAVLTPEEYGVFDMVVTTVSLLFPVFTAMICEAMMRFALDKGADHETIYVCGTVVWGAGFAVLLLLSPLIRFIPSLNGYVLYVVLYYFAYSLYFNLSYFARGIEKITAYTLGGIVQTALTISLNLLFLLVFKAGLKGYLLAYVIADFSAALFLIFATKLYRCKFRFSRKTAEEMLRFSLPMIPNQLSWWLGKSVSKYILNIVHGVATNGIFSVAHKIPTILNALMSIFSGAWRISSVDGLEEDTEKFYTTVYNNYCSFLVLGTSFLILCNKFVAGLLYSGEFYQAHVFVPVLLLSVMFHGLGDHLGAIYISFKRTKAIFVTTFVSSAVNVVLGFALIPPMGIMGAALATLGSYFSLWLVRLIDSRKILRLNYRYALDIATFTLLAVQAVVEFIAFPYSWAVSAALFLAVLILRREAVVLVLKPLRGMLGKIKK